MKHVLEYGQELRIVLVEIRMFLNEIAGKIGIFKRFSAEIMFHVPQRLRK